MKAELINRKYPQILTILTVVCSVLHADIILVPSDVETIQGAIELAEDGDEIIVRPGTYYENINFLGKAITVASIMILNGDRAFIDSTIIDGGNSGATVTFNYREDENSILMGFTITGGRQDFGGGIDCQENSSPILEDLLITRNRANLWGGGIYCTWSASPTIRRVTIENNTALRRGGGIGVAHEANLYLTDVVIRNNTGGENGGGIDFQSTGEISLNDVTFSNNIATYGGGICLESPDTSAFQDVAFTENRALSGAGIHLTGSELSIINGVFENNSARENGGGIYLYGSKLNLLNGFFEGDSAGYYGGAIYGTMTECNLDYCEFIANEASQHGGGIFAVQHSTVTVKSSNFEENTAAWYGGGLNISYDSHLSIYDCILRDNSAPEGGAIRSYAGSSITAIRSQFIYNSADIGGAIHAKHRSNVSLINSTFVNNVADSTGGGCFASADRNVIQIVNSIFWDNQPQQIASASRQVPDVIIVAYSDIMGGSYNIDAFDVSYDEQSNIDSDPLYFEYDSQLHLPDNSPCVDGGTDFYVLDEDTLINYSEDEYVGNAPDMGAMEFDPLGVRLDARINPVEFSIIDAYPNPFNSSISITINLKLAGITRVAIFDLHGREITVLNDKILPAGKSSFIWNAAGYSQGIYFVHLETPSFEVHRKVVFLK